MGGAHSRRKGANYERELAAYLAERLGVNARRGIQYRDGGKEVGDVVGVDPWHIEAKRGKKPNPRAALEQAIADCPKGKVPLAVIRDDHKPAFVVMTLDDWADWVRETMEIAEQ